MAEKEYIERGAVIAEIIAEADKEGKKSYDFAERGCDDLSVKYTHGEYCYSVAAHIAETAPAADVVEVVRCKDCKYFQTAKVNNKGFLICPASGMEITETDYCSYGERKENDKN